VSRWTIKRLYKYLPIYNMYTAYIMIAQNMRTSACAVTLGNGSCGCCIIYNNILYYIPIYHHELSIFYRSRRQYNNIYMLLLYYIMIFKYQIIASVIVIVYTMVTYILYLAGIMWYVADCAYHILII